MLLGLSETSESTELEVAIQQQLNEELNTGFNPTDADHDIDLTAIEFQFYETPDTGNLDEIISDVKTALAEQFSLYYIHDIPLHSKIYK